MDVVEYDTFEKILNDNILINESSKFEDFDYLMNELNVPISNIKTMFHKYNGNVFAYNNDIYETLTVRFAQFLNNCNRNSWHEERQDAIVKYLQNINVTSIIDIGFGVPSRYVKDVVLKNNIRLTLLDKYPEAIRFGKTLLDSWDKNWKKNISFKLLDITNADNLQAKYDLYILYDSIEHSLNPNKSMSSIFKRALVGSKFLFSIPVGPQIPCHFMKWDSEIEALNWVKFHGMKILDSHIIQPNESGDLFTKQEFKFFNVIVLAEK